MTPGPLFCRAPGIWVPRQTTEALLLLANECDERAAELQNQTTESAEAPPHQKPAVPRTRAWERTRPPGSRSHICKRKRVGRSVIRPAVSPIDCQPGQEKCFGGRT